MTHLNLPPELIADIVRHRLKHIFREYEGQIEDAQVLDDQPNSIILYAYNLAGFSTSHDVLKLATVNLDFATLVLSFIREDDEVLGLANRDMKAMWQINRMVKTIEDVRFQLQNRGEKWVEATFHTDDLKRVVHPSWRGQM